MIEDDQKARPTAEFCQVKREIKRGNDICGPGYREEITGYDVTIKQAWERHHELPSRFGGGAALITRSVEWRDLPTIWEKKL